MAEVEGFRCFYCFPKRKFFPNPPPKPSKEETEYDRCISWAPHFALTTALTDEEYGVYRCKFTARHRVRMQTGQTNRWRLPDALGADILGSAQALRAISAPFNGHMTQLITAEGPMTPLTRDSRRSYRFRLTNDRFRSRDDRRVQKIKILEAAHEPCAELSLKEAVARTQKALRASLLPGTIPSASLARANPQGIFAYLSERYAAEHYPDTILHSLGHCWKLHEPFIHKSEVLAGLYAQGKLEKIPLPSEEDICEEKEDSSSIWRAKCRQRQIHSDCSECLPVYIHLDNLDPMITPSAMAVALGNLYREDVDPTASDLAGVLVAAHTICFQPLIESCVFLMSHNITWKNVCRFYKAAVKSFRTDLELACQEWLELNLITQLSTHVILGQLLMEGLLKTLKSPRLFVYDEFSLYKVLVTWLFLQLNRHVCEMPSYTTIVAYFNSFRKLCSVVEKEEGRCYMDVFLALRLHGITDITQIHDIQMTNMLPQNWIASLLTQHYKALTNGGDMSAVMDFECDSIRRGFIIFTEDEPYERTELVTLYGFYFHIKSIRLEYPGNYKFWIERLKPDDPVLTAKEKERETFSTRRERSVDYRILVQHYGCHQKIIVNDTGKRSQCFGLGQKTRSSKVFEYCNLREPLFVLVFFYFPPS